MGISVNGRRLPPGTEAGEDRDLGLDNGITLPRAPNGVILGKLTSLSVHSSLIEREQQLDMLLSENSKALKIMPDTK